MNTRAVELFFIPISLTLSEELVTATLENSLIADLLTNSNILSEVIRVWMRFLRLYSSFLSVLCLFVCLF